MFILWDVIMLFWYVIDCSKRVRKADKGSKGLRHFSMKVCEKVQRKGVTTYNEVADELVQEFTDQAQVRCRHPVVIVKSSVWGLCVVDYALWAFIDTDFNIFTEGNGCGTFLENLGVFYDPKSLTYMTVCLQLVVPLADSFILKRND